MAAMVNHQNSRAGRQFGPRTEASTRVAGIPAICPHKGREIGVAALNGWGLNALAQLAILASAPVDCGAMADNSLSPL